MLLVTAIAPRAALAQTPRCPFAEGPAVDRLRAVLGVVRQGDPAAMRRALESMWRTGPDDKAAREGGVVAVTRLMLQGEGFGEIVLCTPKPGLAVAVLRDTLANAADQLAIEVEPGAESRVMRVTTVLAVRRLPDADAGAPGGDPFARLGAYVDRLAARGAFSGVVLVGRGGETLFARAWGEADREAHVPVTLDTPFNVASLSKIMTATAVLQLVEAGRLSIETDVASILPDVSTDPRFARVRVKHLLSHTSGIESDPNQLAFVPGTGFLYSNRGFRLLGDVIAARTGMRFEDYLRLKVLAPAGMASTARYELKARSPLLTPGYTLEWLDTDGPARGVPSWHVNPYLHTIAGGAMGGLYSTGPDLMRFASALLAGRLVSPATVDLMRTPKPELGAAGYGFGVMRERTPGVWGHGGDLPGADAMLEFYSDGYVVVVLANMDNVAAPILQTTRALFHHPAAAG